VSQEVVLILVNTVHRLSLSQLLDVEESGTWLPHEPNSYQLHISCAQEHQKCGGFKVASPVHVDSTPFMKNIPQRLRKLLYAKQVFYQTQAAKSLPTSTSTITLYLGLSPIACIEMELKCILWAQALLQLSYDYIKTFDEDNGPSPPHLMNPPQFRFVHAALAVEQGKPSRDTGAFLLEEEIKEATEGKSINTLITCHRYHVSSVRTRRQTDFMLIFLHSLNISSFGKLVSWFL
jgi:hypothetical protein